MTNQQIIMAVQSGNNVALEENIFVPMTQEQRASRSEHFIRHLKMNFYKLQARARFKN